MSFDQHDADLKYVIKTLSEARASIVKASKQAKAMGINLVTMEMAIEKVDEAIREVEEGATK